MTKREAGLVLGIRYAAVVSIVITLIGIVLYHSIYYHSFDIR